MIHKRIINFLAALILVFAGVPGLIQPVQGSGGPDNGGYIYDDSSDPGGPVYNWDEISTTGTAVNLANDAVSPAVSLPFSFTFYGTVYNQFYIGSNGFLTFLDKQPDGKTPAAIPTAATPNAIIAGYWANLNPAGSGASVRYQVMGSAPNRRMVVEFNAVPHNGNTNAKVTFEFKLFEGSNAIEVHYNTTATDGSAHVAGIENEAGTTGLQYYNGTEDIANSKAVRYSIFTGVAMRPTYEIKYGSAGTSLVFTQRIANWTGAATTFTLTPTTNGKPWNQTIAMPVKDFRTTAMNNGEALDFTLTVDIPADAVPGDYSEIDLNVKDDATGAYEGSSKLIAAVPRRGYGMGYYDMANGDSASGIVQIDTQFHNSLHEPINGDSMGQYLYYGNITPNGKQLWVVDAGTTNTFVVNLDQINGPYTTITAGAEASDVTFTPDGKTALITSYVDGNVELVDTATYAVTSTLTTGKNSVKAVVGACFPRKAYVTNMGGNTLSVVNLQSKTVTNITGMNKPYGVVVSPKTNWAYVANGGVKQVWVIDTLKDTVVYKWDVADADSMAGIGITPDGERLYVASNTTVKVLNANTGALITTIATPLDKLWNVSVFPEGKGDYAYVTTSNQNLSSILVIDTVKNEVVKEIKDAWVVMGVALFPAPTECNVPPIASFTPLNAIGHVNEPFTWTNTTTYGATYYEWDFGDNSPVSHDEHPTHTYTAPGTYVVSLTAKNSHGESKITGAINFAPRAKFTPKDSLIKAGDSISFINGTTGNDTLEYSWKFGDGATSTEKDPTHTYTTVGDYTVELTAKNSYGTDTYTGTVAFPPIASFTPAETTIRPGESVAFTNTSAGTNSTAHPLTFSWDFGDGSAASTETSPTHTYEGKADATVTLTAHNGYGTDTTATGTVKFKPKAQFTPTSSVISTGDTVSFTDQSIGPGTFTYLWDFGDGASSSEASPQHAFTTEGDYTVNLTVTNSNGSDTATGTVSASSKPVADFTPAATVINLNDTVTFTNKSVGAKPISYTWNFGDGSPESTETNPQHQYTKAGNYTVTLTAKNTAGTSTKTGMVNFYASAVFTPANSVIQIGDSVTFTNLSTGSTPLTYTWDFGDGSATSTETSPTHQYTSVGSYTVKLTAHNTYGPDSTTTGTVVFKPKAAFTPVDSVIKVGDSITFTNQTTGTGTITYSWDFGDGTAASTETSPTHKYTTAGAYSVKLTATSASYGSHSVTGTVLFAPTASFTPKDSVIQAGDSVVFSNTSVGTNTSNNPLTYTWDFGDGSAASTTANPTHQYASVGSYTVKLTAHNGLGTDSVATGTVNFKPKAAFTPANSVIRVGDSITFTNQTTGTGTITYSWNFGDGTAASTAASPTHQYTKAGTYTVTLTATSASYGSHSATGTVAFAPTASFTPASNVIQTGDSVAFTNTSVGTNTSTNPLTYIWDFGDGSPVSTTANPTHQYPTAGNYTVRLTAHNGLGTDSTATGTVTFRPKAAFNPPSSVIQTGDSITFTNLTTGTATITYTWDFGDGTPASTEVNPTHQYTKSGSFTVKLTAHNQYGADSTATGTVLFRPKAAFTQSSSIIRVGDTVEFTNQTTGTETLSYTWDFGDGTPASTEKSPTHQYTTAGVYAVKMTAKNAQGTDSTTGQVVFAPFAAFTPEGTPSKPIVIKLGDTIQFTNKTTGNTPITYTWDFGDGSDKVTDTDPSHTYQKVGTYTVTLTAQNAYGSHTATATVVFAPTASFEPKTHVIHLGEDLDITNLSIGTAPMTYSWDFGDGTPAGSGEKPSHIYAKAGEYTIRMTVTNAYGTDEYTGKVVFAPKADFACSSQTAKQNQPVQFTSLVSGTPELTLTWDFGDGSAVSHELNPTHAFTQAGKFKVTLMVTNAYGSAEHTMNVTSQAHLLYLPVTFH